MSGHNSQWQQRERDLKGQRQLAALAEIEAEFENIRSAWHWAVDQRDFDALDQMADSLYWFCTIRNRTAEALELYTYAREKLAPAAGETPHPFWGRLLAGIDAKSPRAAHKETEAAMAIARQHDNKAEIARCLADFGLIARSMGNHQKAIDYLEQALEAYRALDDRFAMVEVMRNLAKSYQWTDGPQARTADLRHEALALSREIGHLYGTAILLSDSGGAAWQNGALDDATGYFAESDPLLTQIGDRLFRGVAKTFMASIAFEQGVLSRAADLAHASLALANELDNQEEKPYALCLLALVATLHGDHVTAKAHCEEAVAAAGQESPAQALTHGCLAILAANQDDWRAARKHLRAQLKIKRKDRKPLGFPAPLAVGAILANQDGDFVQAAELLALAFTHPLSPNGWLAAWPRITALRAELERKLGADDYHATWERGAKQDLTKKLKELQRL
ncbi:MAG: tetratricopeptide repeat protein [Chloroflexi bacterium]|nr:tetratricopeptide repeat protein [Chloroflexota bacterium]